MSDLQDLIHRQAVFAYEQGVKNEKLRITKLLESQIAACGQECDLCAAQEDAIKLINGEEHE